MTIGMVPFLIAHSTPLLLVLLWLSFFTADTAAGRFRGLLGMLFMLSFLCLLQGSLVKGYAILASAGWVMLLIHARERRELPTTGSRA